MDLYKRYFRKDASQKSLISAGRLSTLVFVIIGALIATKLGDPKFQGIFSYIQEFQGYISPGILAVFVFGMLFKKAPAAAGVTGLIITVPIYGFLQMQFGQIAFLNRMAITFILILIVMAIITLVKPMAKAKEFPKREGFDMKPSPMVAWLGCAVIAAVIALYIIFW